MISDQVGLRLVIIAAAREAVAVNPPLFPAAHARASGQVTSRRGRGCGVEGGDRAVNKAPVRLGQVRDGDVMSDRDVGGRGGTPKALELVRDRGVVRAAGVTHEGTMFESLDYARRAG